MTIEVTTGDIVGLAQLLEKHPFVSNISTGGVAPLAFLQEGVQRRVLVGSTAIPIRGLIETMDNNPIVCAAEVSVPTPGSTLSLIALAPLLRAGLLIERPSVMLTIETTQTDVDSYLQSEFWSEGATLAIERLDLDGCAACTAIAAVATPDDFDEFDDLYEEFYGRSIYVEKGDDDDWDVASVLDSPRALYRLRVTPGGKSSLLTIQTMADLNGKCGAAQIVHAMNLMCGFEETLGIT